MADPIFDPTPIFDLCAEHVRRLAVLDPVWANAVGISEAGGRSTDLSPDGQAAQADLIRDTLRRLAALTPTGPADPASADPASADPASADLAAAGHLRNRLEPTLAYHDSGEPLRSLRAPFGTLNHLRDSV